MVGRFLFFFPTRSAAIARQRVSSMLYMDRLDCPEDTLQHLQHDIRKVIEKYLNIEKADISIRMDIKRESKQGVKNVKTIQIERL